VRRVIWPVVSAAMAFLASRWVWMGPYEPAATNTYILAIVVTATCVACLFVGLEEGPGQLWYTIVLACVLVWGMFLFAGAGGSIGMIAAPLGQGYLVGGTAFVMGIIGSRQRGVRRTGYVLLGLLGLTVLFRLPALHLRPSPECTVRTFARHMVAERWYEAYALLTPDLQRFLLESVPAGPGVKRLSVEKLLKFPPKWSISRIETHGVEAAVYLHRAGAHGGDRADLRLQRQPYGAWLVSGTLAIDSWRRHIERLEHSDSS